jgi:cytochrome P450
VTETELHTPMFPLDIPQTPDYVPEYADFRSQCPVPKVRLSEGGEAYLVTRYEDNRTVLADPVFSRAACMDPSVQLLLEGPRIPGLVVNLDLPEHTRLHRLTVRAFSIAAVARLRPRLKAIANELVDAMLESGPPVDFVTSFGTPFPTRVIFEIFGVPREDVQMLMGWLTQILSYGRYSVEEQASAFQSTMSYFAAHVARKRQDPGDDLTSALVAAHDRGEPFTEEELVSLIWVHVSAGSVAASNILPNTILTFSRHREQWDLLRLRPELLPSAVEECLRFVAAATTSFERMAMEDVELSGTPVPAGSVIIPVLRSANFDESVYTDSERFDITRAESAHLGFGHGPHRCTGAQLGTAELEIALATFLERMPDLRVAVSESELEWDNGVAMRRQLRMPVTW